MYKKILLTAIIGLSVLAGSVALPAYFVTGYENMAFAADPPPSDNLDDTTFMFDLTNITHPDIAGGTRQSWIRGGINYIFERIVGIMAATIGGLCVLVMSYGGFLMFFGEGSYEKGKNYVKFSLIGLVVTLSAYILVSSVQLLIKSIYA
jgi:hypothetical protein